MQNIDEATKRELERSRQFYKNLPEGSTGQSIETTDVYQQTQDRIDDVNGKSFPNGSSPIVSIAVKSVIEGDGAEGLAHAYNRTRDGVESLKERGERGRANLLRQQYMQENFLPAVEVVVNSASPDDLLANKKALSELDKYALLEGAGKGYTASYVRQAYGNMLGQVDGRSDDSVRSGVQKIQMLLDQGEVRTAFGIANGLKKKIDSGEAMADDIDYDMIGRVVAFYE